MAASTPLPSPSQLVEKIPLIKSPSFWVPAPVQLPPDIHPLPESIEVYFVYPHTLESHALSTLPSALHSLEQAHSQRLHLLASLAESKERARKAHLNRLAPGWGEGGGVMEPVRRETVLIGNSAPPAVAKPGVKVVQDLLEEDESEENGTGVLMGDSPQEMGAGSLDRLEREQMQALVDGLAAMDGERTKRGGDFGDLI
ncbi:hypothetical protein RQP46_007021 [Phenoliferia psychrophenolica]